MGIPLYFKKLTNEFENIVVNQKPFETCDRLFLDFNCAIHKCVYSMKCDITNAFISKSEFEILLIEECKKMIDKLYHLILPTKLMYVSIDGVAPMAKISQQRKRRYFSDWKRNELINKSTKLGKIKECEKLCHEWNSNAITPGTLFMKKLINELTIYGNKFKLEHNIDLILDYQKGEGEHNICNYIERTRYDNSSTLIDVIYGMDADMILLGMLSYNCNNTYLLRESTTDNKQFVYMILKNTSKQIYEQFCNYVECSRDDTNINFYIKCYVFLTFILGNDFIPNITYISLRNDGLVKLLIAYRQSYQKLNVHILDQHSKINLDFLVSLFDVLSKNEDSEYHKCETNYYNFTNNMNQNSKKNNFIENETQLIEQYPKYKKFPSVINVNKPGWRRNYYYYLFENNLNTDIIKRTCTSYVQGLIWVANYYFEKKSNEFWFYPFMYSPSFIDLSNYVNLLHNLEDETYIRKYHRDITDLDQLLMVLPPSSSYLIPNEKYREYYTNIKLGLVHLFPKDFEIITYMKYQLHECNGNGVNLVQPLLV
jgi:5'-3' exonuclease